MYKYPQERKQAILRKMAPPHNMTVAELAIEEGINDATLYNWCKTARQQGAILPPNSAVPGKWCSEDKFRTVLQTATMTQAELGEYCRKHGLYPEQVEAWKADSCSLRPKAGAASGNSARTDLSGGSRATGIPTATESIRPRRTK